MKFPLIGVVSLTLMGWIAAGPVLAAKAKTCDGLAATEGVTVEAGVIKGTPGNDVIIGTPGDDTIFGLDGDDVICGEGGDDNIAGGGGSDLIYGGAGDDDIYGDDLPKDGAEFESPASFQPAGIGPGTSPSPAHRDRIYGGDGSDNLSGGEDGDFLDGGSGRDELSGDDGSDRLLGGNGKDYLYGDDGPDYLSGGAGNDMVHGGNGPDEVSGDEGSDELFGDEGDDTLNGGNDRSRDRLHLDAMDARPITHDPNDLCYAKPDDSDPAEEEFACEHGPANGNEDGRGPRRSEEDDGGKPKKIRV
jgi:Ca2+-binding RTX toxin-like protein